MRSNSRPFDAQLDILHEAAVYAGADGCFKSTVGDGPPHGVTCVSRSPQMLQQV
jgi:hypothetical protein